MTLVYLLLVPLIGGLLSCLWQKRSRWISIFSLVVVIAITLTSYWQGEAKASLEDLWLVKFQFHWFHLALDGLSFVLLLVAELIAILGLVLLIQKPKEQSLLLFALGGLTGILLSENLLCFFVFWELALIPIYFWVMVFGKARRNFAALQFILFTQFSGLLLLASMVALHQTTGTLDLNTLSPGSLSRSSEFWIALGLTLAFLVKLPAFPFHTWMPLLFKEAPMGALLSGFMIKTGAYGILRFVIPVFPRAATYLAPFMILLGSIGVLYGAILAYSQKSPRAVFAYSVLSHASLLLMGLFSNHLLALSGSIVLIVVHALASTGILLTMETHFGLALFFVMALLGLPGLGNFVGEFLLLFGLFQEHPVAAMLGALSLVLGAAYWLRILLQLYYGTSRTNSLPRASMIGCTALAGLILWLGLFPAPLLDLVEPTWTDTQEEPEPDFELDFFEGEES